MRLPYSALVELLYLRMSIHVNKWEGGFVNQDVLTDGYTFLICILLLRVI